MSGGTRYGVRSRSRNLSASFVLPAPNEAAALKKAEDNARRATQLQLQRSRKPACDASAAGERVQRAPPRKAAAKKRRKHAAARAERRARAVLLRPDEANAAHEAQMKAQRISRGRSTLAERLACAKTTATWLATADIHRGRDPRLQANDSFYGWKWSVRYDVGYAFFEWMAGTADGALLAPPEVPIAVRQAVRRTRTSCAPLGAA